jgi:hypothetical protein
MEDPEAVERDLILAPHLLVKAEMVRRLAADLVAVDLVQLPQ